jgi:hypothetical protein
MCAAMKRKVMVINPPISTKQTNTCHLNSLNTKNTTPYDVLNSGPDLGQEQKCENFNEMRKNRAYREKNV